MACTGCTTEKNGLPKGCNNNGSCSTGDCGKLSTFDWLSNMQQPTEAIRSPYVEVRFKNERKEIYNNTEKLAVKVGDIVAVETSPGHDIGVVTLVGELARVQLKVKKYKRIDQLPKIYRMANQRDIDVWQEARAKETKMMLNARKIAKSVGLEMKISDVEFQGDGTKATFYYTSDNRVDFRQLIREFASVFKCRVEMRQIGYRQEAAKLGGIGSCGRELCCSTWLTDFRSVSTTAARYQQLSIYPQKIAGQCGKLKCCLNYELDSYLDALKAFPKTDIVLKSANGNIICTKIDVFKQQMWLAYQNTSTNATWYKFTVQQVKGFLAQNKKGNKIDSLEDLNKELNEIDNLFSKDLIEENSLQRFENKERRRRKNRKKKQSTQNKGADRSDKKPASGRRRRNNNRKKTQRKNGGNPKKGN